MNRARWDLEKLMFWRGGIRLARHNVSRHPFPKTTMTMKGIST